MRVGAIQGWKRLPQRRNMMTYVWVCYLAIVVDVSIEYHRSLRRAYVRYDRR